MRVKILPLEGRYLGLCGPLKNTRSLWCSERNKNGSFNRQNQNAAEGNIQSSIIARCVMRPFVEIVGRLANIIIIIVSTKRTYMAFTLSQCNYYLSIFDCQFYSPFWGMFDTVTATSTTSGTYIMHQMWAEQILDS